jgi:hypothetical protein
MIDADVTIDPVQCSVLQQLILVCGQFFNFFKYMYTASAIETF